MDEALSFLEDEGLSPGLLRDLKTFRAAHPAPVAFVSRIPAPRYRYYGRRVWEQALTALLCGENLLLSGGKATGKNVLAENLAMVFGRPAWNVSLHVNTDAYGLMGTDTLRGGEVSFRPGPVWLCAAHGGFCILDEVNMARNEALAVLHAALDHRRALDVPGYERLPLCEETRFIGTMNYGYAGTRELNEALTSRFAVLHMPTISAENLTLLLRREFPTLRPRAVEILTSLFFDLEKKCANAEITSRALDLRGLLDAVDMMRHGLSPDAALAMGLTNKTFDAYERTLVEDVIRARIGAGTKPEGLFSDGAV
ncbi:MAG: MoxR family ATPase [Eubacteriales bacterium]|nr:MoxR family ATPase [Eubacteriales bacterium]